jgi:hypothetical protein
MAALTQKRMSRSVKFSDVELAAKNEAVFQGGIACFDTSTGLVAKAFVSTTLIPIGLFAEDSAAAASKVVPVKLFREVEAVWMPNAGGGEAVVAANIGGLCYLRDDNTVGVDDDTNTLSVFGRVWKLDTNRGVLVEPLYTAGEGTVSGLDG